MADRDPIFDWVSGEWVRTLDSAGRGDGRPAAGWRLTVASDWAPIRAYTPIICDRPDAIYGDLDEVLREGDLNVVNVEAILGDAGQPIPKAGPPLRGPAEAAAALPAGHFHVACLANNHAMDYGPEGLGCTLEALAAHGLTPVGAGMTRDEIERPVIRTIRGVRVALVNCAEGESGRSLRGEPGVYGMDAAKVGRQVHDLKADGEADVVVVIFHGGREYCPVPPPYVVRELRQVAEAGADAVVAHHPHVPQGIEIHRGVPIAYSLGNFVFWQEQPAATRRVGYLLHLDFRGAELSACRVTPYALQPTGLRRMTRAQREWFYASMADATAALRSEEAIHAAWSAFVARQDNAAALNNLARLTEGVRAGGEGSVVAAARLRNLFLTPAHHDYFVEMLQQRMIPDATPPAWATALVQRWDAENPDFPSPGATPPPHPAPRTLTRSPS